MSAPTWDKYENKNILKIDLIVEAPPSDMSSSEFSSQEQWMFNNRGWFVSPNTPAREQSFINYVTSYAYDAAYVMDNNNYAPVLESFMSTSSLHVAQVNTKKVSGHDHLVLPKK